MTYKALLAVLGAGLCSLGILCLLAGQPRLAPAAVGMGLGALLCAIIE
ncbi:hypothetical protein IB275_30350 [Pseudomonas sp. PDM21]|nr:hypothetical protein [Pseudomonas sp. PDM21]MBD9674917.1 hypothetical protein [Pseudomonas sp. PDM21]